MLRKRIYGGPGPPATIARELGQVRKEAAAASDLCAGMWLGLPPLKNAAFISGVLLSATF